MLELPPYPSGSWGPDVPEYPTASAARRLAAQAIDAAAVLAPVGLLWGSVTWHTVVTAGPDDWQLLLWIVVIAVGYGWLLLGWPLVEVVSVAIAGRTLGQLVSGLRLAKPFGQRAGFTDALSRGFLLSWSATVAGTLVLCAWVHWPPVVLLVAFPWTCLATASVQGHADGWLGAATGTRLVRASRLAFWDRRSG